MAIPEAIVGGLAVLGGFVVAVVEVAAVVGVVAAPVVGVDSTVVEVGSDCRFAGSASLEEVLSRVLSVELVRSSLVVVVSAAAAMGDSSPVADGVRATTKPMATRAVERIKARIVRCIDAPLEACLGDSKFERIAGGLKPALYSSGSTGNRVS
jgi:hypothetical protein